MLGTLARHRPCPGETHQPVREIDRAGNGGNRVLWEHRGRAPHVREPALHDGRVLVD